jgi:hypothetical protein
LRTRERDLAGLLFERIMTPSTPKSFVLLAKDEPAATILYRRSRLTSYVLQLDYGRHHKGYKGKLTKGSRFYGRFFPERCDVSPDGKLMVYFVMRGRKTGGSADPVTWTAVCTPPWLRAHLFCPNGSTWGGGGRFLGGKTLVVFDNIVGERREVDGYRILSDLKKLDDTERHAVSEVFRPPPEKLLPRPRSGGRREVPCLVRYLKPGVANGYDMFDYILRDESGGDVPGAEDVILANWAGWDIYGRLMVAAGRHLRFYEVGPRQPLGKPCQSLDLETAIAGTA